MRASGYAAMVIGAFAALLAGYCAVVGRWDAAAINGAFVAVNALLAYNGLTWER